MTLHLPWNLHYAKFSFEDTKQTRQSIVVEIKEAPFAEALWRQQHIIFGIWIPLKTLQIYTAFLNIYGGSNIF